jgi:hypothetical protein
MPKEKPLKGQVIPGTTARKLGITPWIVNLARFR